MSLSPAELNIMITGNKPDGTKASQAEIDLIKSKATAAELQSALSGGNVPKSDTKASANSLFADSSQKADDSQMGLTLQKNEAGNSTNKPDTQKEVLASKNRWAKGMGLSETQIDDFLTFENKLGGKGDSLENDKPFYKELADKLSSPEYSSVYKNAQDFVEADQYQDPANPTTQTNDTDCGLGVATKALSDLNDPFVDSLSIEQKVALTTLLDKTTVESQLAAKAGADTTDQMGLGDHAAGQNWGIMKFAQEVKEQKIVERAARGNEEEPDALSLGVGFADYKTSDTIDSINVNNYNKGMAQVTGVPRDSFLANTTKKDNIDSGFTDPTSINFFSGVDTSGDKYNSLNEIANSPYSGFLGDTEKEIIKSGGGDKYGYSMDALTDTKGQHPFGEVFGVIPEKSDKSKLIDAELAKLSKMFGRKLTDAEIAKFSAAFEKQD